MKYSVQPEYWLRGAVEQVPPLLQPVAHALLQARAEVNSVVSGLPGENLWAQPNGVAAPGFHLQHITGVIDRLFTYARGESLSDAQMDWMKGEGKNKSLSLEDLLKKLNDQVDKALEQLKITDPAELTDIRYVGRKRIPSTTLGLLSHAAEHSMRHLGQLLVTIRMLTN
jgi:uncharacterized damage-inducible protein DinB